MIVIVLKTLVILSLIFNSVYCSSGEVYWIQYSNYLQVQYQLTLQSLDITTNAIDSFCINTPTAVVLETVFFEISITESYNNFYLNDFEIYFEPTSQYIGQYVGGGTPAKQQLNDLSSLQYSPSPGYTGSYKGALKNMVSGFNEICFTNVCGSGNHNCNHENGFTGYINLYGVYLNSDLSTSNSGSSNYQFAIILTVVLFIVILTFMIVCLCKCSYKCAGKRFGGIDIMLSGMFYRHVEVRNNFQGIVMNDNNHQIVTAAV